MNKKLINLLIITIVITIVFTAVIPSAQAGLIDWFMGLFGLTSPSQVTNYVNDKGFELYTDKIKYNCFPNNFIDKTIVKCQEPKINITKLSGGAETIYLNNIFNDDVDIKETYIKDENGKWVRLPMNIGEVTNNKLKKKTDGIYITKGQTIELKVDFLPTLINNGKFDLMLNTPAGDVILDPYYNASNGFYVGTKTTGLSGIATNDTDFWVLNSTGVNHYTQNGVWKDMFNIASIGSNNPVGITMNRNDKTFWILDNTDKVVYHITETGTNITSGDKSNLSFKIPIQPAPSTSSYSGITNNRTDIWIGHRGNETGSGDILHFNSTRGNGTKPITLETIDGGNPNWYSPKITTNGTDFFIVNVGAGREMLHLNSTLQNQSDTFSVTQYGMTNPQDIDISYTNSSILVPDLTDLFIYHFERSDLGYNNIAIYQINFSSSVFEGQSTILSINFTLNLTTSTYLNNVTLNYNGTNYTAVTVNSSSNYLSSVNMTIPYTSAVLPYTIPFYFVINSNNGIYNSDTNNQIIYPVQTLTLGIYNCSAGLNASMYFDFKDEENLSDINVSIDYNFKYGTSMNNTLNLLNGNIPNTHKLFLCINSSLMTDYYNIGYGELQYQQYQQSYVKRRFYVFENQRINNITISNSLYDLINGDATSFLFTIKDPALSPYKDKYLTLMRWYPNLNNYIVVDMGMTDDKGETVMRVKTEDVDYRIGVYNLNGSLIYLAKPVRFVCLASPCTYSLIVQAGALDFTSFLDVETSLEYNSALKMFTFVWNDPTQLTQNMTLEVNKEIGNSTRNICTKSATGFTGLLFCNVTGYTGLIRATAFRTASPETPIAQKIIQITGILFKSTLGLFMIFLFSAFLFFMGIASPIIAIILGVVAFIPAMIFGTVSMEVVIGIGVLGGIIIHFMKRT